METFSALGGAPASECMRMAADADAVVCIVAHRYGYVPPVELGGDGERSITWLEVDAAKRAGKPVFAFLVDPKAPWTEVKEQDRLVSEPEKLAEIAKAVRKLQEFKDYLGRETTRQTFASQEQLAEYVAITLANFAPRPTATARVWRPLFCHALQPAQHFRGRVAKLQELKDWLQSRVTADRVISVVAAGGAGKTALVNKALHEATLSDRAGVFVWSFYEDPHTDAFLRAAYPYFPGEKDAPAGGMLERARRTRPLAACWSACSLRFPATPRTCWCWMGWNVSKAKVIADAAASSKICNSNAWCAHWPVVLAMHAPW